MRVGFCKSSSVQLLKLLALLCTACVVTRSAPGQDPIATSSQADATPDRNYPDRDYIDQQIDDLDHSSYRTRQLARWRLEQSPQLTLEAMQARLNQVGYNTAAQLVDILSSLATHADVSISLRARETLQQHANRVSALGRMADNALHAIADLQEGQALEILRFHGARFGSSNFLGIVLNGKPMQESEDFALYIDSSFTGADSVVAWIQFLKTVNTVYLEGPQINQAYFRAIAELPNIKKLKCKNVSMSPEDVSLLKNIAWLELLELAYVDINDDYLSVLEELPVSETLRLFGTNISPAGAEQLARQLDGIEIYCGKGGHLGIATHPSNTLVTAVNNNTGAHRAGIRENDELTHVNGVEIHNMAELRTELAKHAAGDSIEVRLTRQPFPNVVEDHTVTVTLTEDPN